MSPDSPEEGDNLMMFPVGTLESNTSNGLIILNYRWFEVLAGDINSAHLLLTGNSAGV